MLHTKRITILISSVTLLLAGAWGFLQWELHRLETAIWVDEDFARLKKRKALLEWITTSPVRPEGMRMRAHGLLGDLYFHDKAYGEALDHYYESSELLRAKEESASWNPIAMLDLKLSSQSKFGKGFADYQTKEPVPETPSDGDLEPGSHHHAEELDSWNDFEAITPLSELESEEIRTLFSSADEKTINLEAISSFCENHQDAIDAIRRLGTPLKLPDQNELPVFAKSADFVRLMFLDSLNQAHADNEMEAERSLKSTFRLLSYYEQNPQLLSLLVAFGLRSEINAALLSENGGELRPHFRDDFQMGTNFFEDSVAGEYQTFKSVIETSVPGADPVSRRLRIRFLQKQAAFWRSVRDDFPNAQRHGESDRVLSDWFFRNRRFRLQAKTGSYSEGYHFASELEDGVAEMVHQTAIPNLGRLDLSLENLKADEGKLRQ